MNTHSIYSDKPTATENKSTRYIYIKVKNVSWIVNRISSLFRRRRYSLQEFSVDFNNDNTSNIVIVVDGELFDIWQIVNQITKIYDVLEAYDATYQKEMLYYSYFVDSEYEKIKWCSFSPIKAIKMDNIYKLIYHINVTERQELQDFLDKNWFTYKERLTTLF